MFCSVVCLIRTGRHFLMKSRAKNVTKGFSLLLSACEQVLVKRHRASWQDALCDPLHQKETLSCYPLAELVLKNLYWPVFECNRHQAQTLTFHFPHIVCCLFPRWRCEVKKKKSFHQSLHLVCQIRGKKCIKLIIGCL